MKIASGGDISAKKIDFFVREISPPEAEPGPNAWGVLGAGPDA